MNIGFLAELSYEYIKYGQRVSKAYSPPGVAAIAHKLNLRPGFLIDLSSFMMCTNSCTCFCTKPRTFSRITIFGKRVLMNSMMKLMIVPRGVQHASMLSCVREWFAGEPGRQHLRCYTPFGTTQQTHHWHSQLHCSNGFMSIGTRNSLIACT